MGTADCLSEEQLAARAAGDGDPVEAESVDAHLEACPKCRHRLDAFGFDPGFLQNVREAAREDSEDDRFPDSAESLDHEHARSDAGFPDIPGYRIRREVGRGGMGLVFDAIQMKLNRSVALKVLPPMMARISTSAVQRFRAEASAAARLHHNNIIPIYDFGEAEGAYYYAMELIHGEPLSRVIRRLAAGSPSSAPPTQLTKLLPSHPTQSDEHSADSSEPDSAVGADSQGAAGSSSTGTGGAYYRQVAVWMRDVADALHHAHGKGVIHRDIKPANLILAHDGRLMVADFGLAKSTDTESVTVTGSLVGTWRYMSPEQALARRMPVDHRTDIYSLAATMYELLTFRPAFPGSDEKEIISKVITQDPVRPRKIIRSVPAELETICLKALEKSRDARYDDAAAFADEFRRYLDDRPIVAKPPGPIVRAWKFAKRHRAAVSILAALSLFLASTALWINSENKRAASADSLKVSQNDLTESENKRKAQEEAGKRVRIANAIDDGLMLMARGSWQDAEKSFDEALRLDPENIEALGNLAAVKKELYNSMSAVDRDQSLLTVANELCDKALRLDTEQENHSRILNTKGVILKLLDRLDEGIGTLLQAQRLDETDYTPVVNLPQLYALKHDLDTAYRWSTVGLQMLADPATPDVGGGAWLHHNLGAILFLRKDPAAGESLAAAEELMSGFAPTLALQARACLEFGGCGGRHDALYYATRADDEAVGDQAAVAKRLLAMAYLRADAYDEAVTAARAAIDLGDFKTVNHLILAAAHAGLGDQDTARDQLAQARENWPEELTESGQYTVTAPAGFLWFESADELLALQDEAEAILHRRSP